MKKQRSYLIQVTLRTRVVDPKAPGQLIRTEMVLVEDSLVKAFEVALDQCPSNMEIVLLTISETTVYIPTDSWTETKEGGNT